MARLLTPDAAGHAATGLGIIAIAFSLREFVTPEFLIQRSEISDLDVRTSFTLLLLITMVIGAVIFICARPISEFYRSPELMYFLLLAVGSTFAEVISLPLIAVMRRDMMFGTLANIRTIALVISAATTVSFAMLGFDYVSYGWGLLSGSIVLALLTAIKARATSLKFTPSLTMWRSAVAFGRFKGASQAIDRIYEAVPQLILGKIVSMASVGLYSRATTVCGISDRMIMSAFYSMAFPTLAQNVRDGGDTKQAYLFTLSYLSVLYWPGALLIALTAQPLVDITLGSQWEAAIPLVRILAVAGVFWFAVIVVNPLLLALGKNRDAFVSSLVSRILAAAAIFTASYHGVTAMALSQFVSVPMQLAVAIYFARKHLHFSAREFVLAIWPSAIVTIFSLSAPVVFLCLNDWPAKIGVADFLAILLLAGLGWLLGLTVTRHPFLQEVLIVTRAAADAAGRVTRRFRTYEA
jgi:O-antigen/teichoic acid export membrane protein